MNHDDLPLLLLPMNLSDQDAAKLLDFFYDAARVLEQHYAAELQRYHHRPDHRQHNLWDDDGPPF